MNYYVSLIRSVVDDIENNLGSELSLSFIAGKTSMSAFHFTRIFKAVTGISLKQYIINRKLVRAKKLLIDTSTSVTDIALMLGFEYPEVFSRAFKRQTGMSPSSFRSNPKITEDTSKITYRSIDILRPMKMPFRFIRCL